jgi:hypothetical protein
VTEMQSNAIVNNQPATKCICSCFIEVDLKQNFLKMGLK